VNRRQFLKLAGVSAAGIASLGFERTIRATENYNVYLPFVTNTKTNLKHFFAQHGIDFGFAGGCFSGCSLELVNQEAAVITTEVAFKTEKLRPERYTFYPDDVDCMYEIANNIEAKFHGHTLCWHSQNPQWFLDLPNEEVPAILEENIAYIAEHWGDKLYSLDVVNETFIDEVPFGKWYEAMGLDYVYQAFDLVAAYMPNVIRVYNSTFWNEADKAFAFELINSGRAQAIGQQAHIWAGNSYLDLDFAQSVVNMGVDLYLSEISVRGAEDEESFNQEYIDLANFAIQSGASRFVIWGTKDPTWAGDSSLHYSDCTAKPAYYEIINNDY